MSKAYDKYFKEDLEQLYKSLCSIDIQEMDEILEGLV